jgi:hypothetical protein
MKDQSITYITAVLAKEKGFVEECHSYYFEDEEFKEYSINDTYGYYGEEYTVDRDEFYDNWNSKYLTKKSGDRCFGCSKDNGYFETYSAPIQCELQKWLREVHNEYVFVAYGELGFTWKIYSRKEGGFYKTYEEALEKGLLEALKSIKI